MLILGIETSCDETAAAVVKNGREVKANVIASQIEIHRQTGGVVPEVAAREHVGKMLPVISEALNQAGVTMEKIEAIAVTERPGLVSSLLVGTNTANTLALITGKPLIPVNHIEGHIYANWLDIAEEIKFPLVVLTVSGGHNELVLMRDYGDLQIIGSTRDDAAGEAFDKVARLLGLPYPGGPEIARLANKARLKEAKGGTGNSSRYNLPRALMNEGFDFSFSGLKSAMMRLISEEKARIEAGEANRNKTDCELGQSGTRANLTEAVEAGAGTDGSMSCENWEAVRADLAASFEEAVCDVLSAKLARAVEDYEAQEAHLAGGVSANLRLREMAASRLDVPLRFPQKIIYCTDNAAMIAVAGYFNYQKKPASYKDFRIVEACATMGQF